MTKLKTLKDIADEYDGDYDVYILQQEAKKWIDNYQKNIDNPSSVDWGYGDYNWEVIQSEGAINFIKYFFNIGDDKDGS